MVLVLNSKHKGEKMNVEKDVRIVSVTLQSRGFNRGVMLEEYIVHFEIKGNSYDVILFHEDRDWYVWSSYLDGAMVAYYNQQLKEMGSRRSDNRINLATKITNLAKQFLKEE